MTQTALETLKGVMTQIAPVPAGIDPGRLAQWNRAGKFNYETVRSMIGAAIQALNEERALAWSDLIALTDEQAIEYMNGGAVEPAEITMGKSRPPLVRGNNAGHMIDLQVWSLAFGGDSRTLADMTESQLVGSVVGLATALRDRFDYTILYRVFNNADVTLGSTGASVGFCNGSPGTVKFAPPKFNGQTFYEDHNHYIALDSATKTFDDAFQQLAKLVAEHGLPLNTDFKIYVSESDVTTIRALTNYVMPVNNVSPIRGGLTSGAIFYESGAVGSIPASGGRYIGAYNTAYGFGQLYSTPRIPTGYSFLYRPGPAFAANNALAVRYRPPERAGGGFGCFLKEIPDYNTTFPIKEIDVEDEYGVSAGKNRYAGACAYLANGASSYVVPTISL